MSNRNDKNRWSKIHQEAIVIDALNCSIMDDEYFEKAKLGGVTAINYTLSVSQNLSETIKIISKMYKIINNSKRAILIESATDIKRAKEEKKVGIIFGFQNIAPLEGNRDLVYIFYKLGVRIIQLTYHFKNVCGDGCKEKTNSGLSLFGEDLIKIMNKLGIVIDLSHVGEKTEIEAIKISKHPVISSHSNVYSLVPTYQNKKDEMIKFLASKGGVIGISAFGRMLGEDFGEEINLENMLNHIDYVVNLVGIDHVGVGSDFCEGWLDSYSHRKTILKIDGKIYKYPKKLDTIVKFPDLTKGLISRGYSNVEIKKILGGNFLRVFNEVMV